MLKLGVIGAPQLLILTTIITIIFFLGFYVGKKSGYIKRLKEEEAKTQNH
jgi:hypothetical protein